MKRLSNPLRLASVLLVIALLAACAPGQPTPSQEEINAAINTSVAQTVEAQGQMATSVALTVAAQNTQTAAAIPSPTNTQTAASVFETNTPRPSDTPSQTLPPPATDASTATMTVTPQLYACDVYTQNPKDRDEVRPGENFKIKWIIVNTGNKAWRPGVDVKFSDGSQMTTATFVEIPNALQPGEQYTIVLNAVAPNEQGLHYMTWIVEGGLCYAYIAIDVK